MIVGAGPAGLECARALGQRGYDVTLAEASDALGGRVTIESQLPGLSSWARVRDYRTHALQTMPNVDIYRGSELQADEVLEFDCLHAVIATGATWTREVIDAEGNPMAIDGSALLTPADVLAGAAVTGPVVIYDFDHYAMGGCLAELLRSQGHDVTLVTNANAVSAWTFMNNESARIRKRLVDLGVRILLEQRVENAANGQVDLVGHYGDSASLDCESLVVVGRRQPNDTLYRSLVGDADRHRDAGIASVRAIGDCRAPGAIAHAVYSGHECARTLDPSDDRTIAWERPAL